MIVFGPWWFVIGVMCVYYFIKYVHEAPQFNPEEKIEKEESDELLKWFKLKESGAISEEEFLKKKEELL